VAAVGGNTRCRRREPATSAGGASPLPPAEAIEPPRTPEEPDMTTPVNWIIVSHGDAFYVVDSNTYKPGSEPGGIAYATYPNAVAAVNARP
jgi:hypothetical protein